MAKLAGISKDIFISLGHSRNTNLFSREHGGPNTGIKQGTERYSLASRRHKPDRPQAQVKDTATSGQEPISLLRCRSILCKLEELGTLQVRIEGTARGILCSTPAHQGNHQPNSNESACTRDLRNCAIHKPGGQPACTWCSQPPSVKRCLLSGKLCLIPSYLCWVICDRN